MGLPARTRIILIPEDEQPSREYGITRPMVITLVVLLAGVLLLLALLMFSFARKTNDQAQISDLSEQLATAEQRADRVETLSGQLRQELLIMQSMQARLLFMLGVEESEPASADSLLIWLEQSPASAAQALDRAATLSVSQPPGRWPATGLVTMEFNKGNLPNGIKPHQGIDIAAVIDTPVLASGKGVVTRSATDDFLGNFVEIQHGLGYVTVYGHCSRLAVSEGDLVDGGQVIAYVGQSGQASAPHLHFEIRHQGEAVDPREYLVGNPPTH